MMCKSWLGESGPIKKILPEEKRQAVMKDSQYFTNETINSLPEIYSSYLLFLQNFYYIFNNKVKTTARGQFGHQPRLRISI